MSTQTTTLSAMRPQQQEVSTLPTVNVGLTSLQGFELVQRAAKLLASSTLVPKEYQGNIANCVIALNMAARVGADPLMVMQNLVIVHGRPTWSSQFLISTVNTCGRFTALRYEFFGEQNTDSWGCRAWAIEKATGERLVGTDVTIGLAKAEGWHGKNGSKWKTMPQQMLMYRAGSWWTRAYAPELSMGLHTKEEMQDVYDAEKLEDGSYTVNLEGLRQQSADEPPHDEPKSDTPPATGEIIEPLQPAKIPAKAIPGDATKTDWDSWVERWEILVNGMADEQSLNKLRKLNEGILKNLESVNPPKYAYCLETYTNRMVAVGAVKEAA